jgi:murein DD-endopeptidase MepM/ murein hydrolase activator NlpD
VGDVRYRYYHLSGFAEGLATGDWVVAGQLIGYVGDTGNPGAGNHHQHFEVRPDNVPVDPVPLHAIPSTCTVLPKP